MNRTSSSFSQQPLLKKLELLHFDGQLAGIREKSNFRYELYEYSGCFFEIMYSQKTGKICEILPADDVLILEKYVKPLDDLY